MIMGGKVRVWACSTGLSMLFDVNAAFGLCTMAHPQPWRAEPHTVIPAVHIAPPGTSVGMLRAVAGLYGGVEGDVGQI